VEPEQAARLDVWGRMTLLAQAVDAGGDRLDHAASIRASVVLHRAGERMRLGADLTVIALVGPTGGGKSSMFNALAGMDIAEVGTRRPTTADPTACVWGTGDADPLLDWLEVPVRNRTRRETVLDADSQAALHGLVLLDLPDHDSAFANHRLDVDRLVDLADLVIWVVDPQKYADEALHSGYLRPHADRGDVMVVVLNQIDTLRPGEVETCERDLRRLLEADGLGSVPTLTASARRGDGAEQLREVLAATVRQRASAVDRTLADLTVAAAELGRGVAPTEPDLEALGVSARLVASLGKAAGVPVMLDALDAGYRQLAANRLGWPFLRWWRWLRSDPSRRLERNGAGTEPREPVGVSLPKPTPSQQAQVDLAARGVADAVAESLPARWAFSIRSASGWHRGGSGLSAALDSAVRDIHLDQPAPLWWLAVGITQVVLAAIAVFGFVWLAMIGVLDWVRTSPLVVPSLGPLPLPTAMLLGGLVFGGALVAVSGFLVGLQARQRHQQLVQEADAAVAGIAEAWVLDPVGEVLADHKEVREALAALR
jgi:GTP-binding protein EngB required for normal cell division